MKSMPTTPGYTFYEASDRAKRPRVFELANGDVRFSLRSPETGTIPPGGLGWVNTHIRLEYPKELPKLVFSRPEWMPDHVLVNGQIDPDGIVLACIVNQSDTDPLVIGRGAWVLVGLVKRSPEPVSWWERFLDWLGLN